MLVSDHDGVLEILLFVEDFNFVLLTLANDGESGAARLVGPWRESSRLNWRSPTEINASRHVFCLLSCRPEEVNLSFLHLPQEFSPILQ